MTLKSGIVVKYQMLWYNFGRIGTLGSFKDQFVEFRDHNNMIYLNFYTVDSIYWIGPDTEWCTENNTRPSWTRNKL